MLMIAGGCGREVARQPRYNSDGDLQPGNRVVGGSAARRRFVKRSRPPDLGAVFEHKGSVGAVSPNDASIRKRVNCYVAAKSRDGPTTDYAGTCLRPFTN